MSILLAALITVIPAQQRFGKRITIALDVSGSLYAKRAEALEAALEVLALTATDETEIRLATFGGADFRSEVLHWPIDPRRARAWLEQHTPVTSTVTMLQRTLDAAQDWGDVIVVTDGLVDDAARCQVRKGRTVGVVLVGAGPATPACAKRLGKTGGVYRVRARD